MGELVGRILLGLIVLTMAVALWPITIICLIIVFALWVSGSEKRGPMNQYGFKPMVKRKIWQYEGLWYTTDGHPDDPIVIGPFASKRYAEEYVGGAHFLADDEGLFSIRV